MYCGHCGAELRPGDKMCSQCGYLVLDSPHSTDNSERASESLATSAGSQNLPDVTVQNSSIGCSIPKKKKTGLKVLGGIVILIVAGLTISSILKNNHYKKGIELYDDGNYEKALAIFSSLEEYKEAESYVQDCTYQMGLSAFNDKDYQLSLSILSNLGDYKDSKDYVHKSRLGMKYELFDLSPNSGDSSDDYSLTDTKKVEKYLREYFYIPWYNSVTGEVLIFDELNFAGNFYGVKSATLMDYWLSATCYFLDEPDKEFHVANESKYFDYIDQSVSCLVVDFADDFNIYYNVTLDEYNSLVALEEEEMAKIPNYDNQTIIEKTISTFKAKVGGNYSGPDTLYHGVDYSDANVSYDSSQKIYTCTMTAEYTTNIFDFWGTSTQTYFVTAEYQDTGESLVLLNFDLY